ncbi:calcium:proton antiporter [Dankookia rubra]|uniref:Calcium:proton antiporter n=2 Tax=Dankookia rubra TaxID=1442381 RepID=A0A4R5QLC6_9PROT|nr:calcium:proton antiporter [Dankookia rubra]
MASWLRLAAGWGSVAAFFTFGAGWLAGLADPLAAAGLFAWLLGLIIWLAFGVVHEAEELAEMLGEPYGTLILTLSIVIIEVALISAVMLGTKEAPELGRDTMFAVLMIVLNGVVGLGLLVGGMRHREQSYNLQGAAAYLAVMIPLSVIALVLPNFTTSTADGSLTPVQAGCFSLFTILLYGIFLWLQTGRHSGFFVDPAEADALRLEGPPRKRGAVLPHVGLLLANILPIVILAKSLAAVLDFGIHALGAPPALGGVLIAMVVFTPEGLSALRAVAANQLQRAVNLCLGAAASTLGLTVPAVLMIGLLTGRTVVLGLSASNMVLLVTTLILSGLTFSGPRTTMLEGAVHLTLFGVFFVLIFSP